MRDEGGLFVRARKPEQIAQRREAILAAMSVLLQSEKPELISLNQVARQAGLAKSNVYRYFDSREAIMLALLREDGLRWMASIESALEPLHGSEDVSAVAHALARVTASEVRLCQLISMASSVLEQNVSDQAVLDFKWHTHALMGRLVMALGRTLPRHPVEQLTGTMHLFIALIAGLWSQSHPVETVRKALQDPNLAVMRVDFEEALGRAMCLLFKGLQSAHPMRLYSL